MSIWEEYVRKVTPYTPGEQPKRADIIKLNTNENPYPPAPGVALALQSVDAGRLRLYPDPVVADLVHEIAEFYQVGDEQVFVGVGSDDVLAMIFLTFFNAKSRSCSRTLPTRSMTCGRTCSGFRTAGFRWMRIF